MRAAQHRRAGDTACGGRVPRVSCVCARGSGAERGCRVDTARMRRMGCRVFVSVGCLLAAAPPVLASTLHALLANGNIHLFVSANHGPVTHFLANESAACCPARRCRGDPLSPGVNPLIEFLHLDIDAVMSTRYVKTVPYVLAGGILYSSNVVSMHPPPGNPELQRGQWRMFSSY